MGSSAYKSRGGGAGEGQNSLGQAFIGHAPNQENIVSYKCIWQLHFTQGPDGYANVPKGLILAQFNWNVLLY